MKAYRSSSLLVLLVLASFPTSTDAIFVWLFNIIANFIYPNWEQRVSVQITLSGFFDFAVNVGCNDIGATTCDMALGAKGSIFGSLGDGVNFDGKTTCDFGPGEVTLDLGGNMALDGVTLNKCEIDLTVASLPPGTTTPVCDCTLGCGGSDAPLSVAVVCTADLPGDGLGPIEVLDLACGNVLDLFDAVTPELG